jgi:hypothetical protein
MRGSLTCSYPGCERHPSKGDDVIRISAKGPGQPFIGRCREHLGADVPPDLEDAMGTAKRLAPHLSPDNPVIEAD